MRREFDARKFAIVDRIPVLSSIVGEPDEIEQSYLLSEGARQQTKEDPGPDYWKACAELGSWIMYWMTIGWFKSWSIRLHMARRPIYEDHLALSSLITVSWTSYDLAYGSQPFALSYTHWLLDPDAISMLVWPDDPTLSPKGLGRSMANMGTMRLRQYLRNENLDHLGGPAWDPAQPLPEQPMIYRTWPSSSAKESPTSQNLVLPLHPPTSRS